MGARVRFSIQGKITDVLGFETGEDYDAFEFTPASNGMFNIRLDPNGEDLDLYLFNLDTGVLIESSTGFGGVIDRIDNLVIETTITYVVLVVPWDLTLASGNGNYSLDISRN